MMIENDLFLRACRFEETDRTPVWLMRQAGRYLPEYQATRARAGSFMGLAKSPSYAAEVTLQPLDRYALDAAILFSDILTIPDAMGLGLSFVNGEGPQFAHPLNSEDAVKKLQVADMQQLNYVFDAVKEIRTALIQNGKQRVPLIGFSGSPWTLACYMIEGSGSKDFLNTKKMLYNRPDLMHHILDINIESVAQYLERQIDAGAQAAMIFDTWGGMLSHHDYQPFSLDPMTKIIKRLKSNPKYAAIPVIIFTKGGGGWLPAMANAGADVIGLDWTVELKQARQTLDQTGKKLAIQGNVDPLLLLADPAKIAHRVTQSILNLAQAPAKHSHPLNGHIFNLGHGINQLTPPEHVNTLIAAVKDASTRARLKS
jgi:uroporphyrinogen decarboxylase